MQQDKVVLGQGQWGKSCLQAAQPVDGWGLKLMAYSQEDQMNYSGKCSRIMCAQRDTGLSSTCSSLMVMR